MFISERQRAHSGEERKHLVVELILVITLRTKQEVCNQKE